MLRNPKGSNNLMSSLQKKIQVLVIQNGTSGSKFQDCFFRIYKIYIDNQDQQEKKYYVVVFYISVTFSKNIEMWLFTLLWHTTTLETPSISKHRIKTNFK